MVPIIDGVLIELGIKGLNKIHNEFKKKNPTEYLKHYIISIISINISNFIYPLTCPWINKK